MLNLGASANASVAAAGPSCRQRAASSLAAAATPSPFSPALTRRPPSLLAAAAAAGAVAGAAASAHAWRSPTLTTRAAATLVPAAAAARKTADAAAAPPKRKAAASSDDDDADEPTPAQVLAQVTRRIRDHGKSGRVRDAIAELASLSEKGLQPDRMAATALVAACAARPTVQNMATAEGVFEELFGDGDGGGDADGEGDGPLLRPDEVTFAVLLRGYGAATPPLWPRIDATLGRMRRAFAIAPTVTSYNALLEACVRTGDMDRAMDVVDRMADDGVEGDAQTAVICARKRALRAYARKALEI